MLRVIARKLVAAAREVRLLMAVTAACTLASSPASAFEAVIQSHAGDWAGGGQDDHVVAPDAAIEVVPDPWGITMYAPRWIFSFSAPDRAPLFVGEFKDAQRHGFQDAGHPGLDVSGFGGCNKVAGQFTVHDVAFAVDGRLLRLAIDGVQHCEGSPRPLYLFVRYGPTAVPLFVPRTEAFAGDDRIVAPGAAIELDGTASTAADGGTLAYKWSQVAGPRVSLGPGPVVSFTMPSVATEWTALVFQLRVTDGSGNSSADRVTIVASEKSQHENRLRFEDPGRRYLATDSFETSLVESQIDLGRNNQNGIEIEIADLPLPGAPTLRMTTAAYRYEEIGIGQQNITYRFAAGSGKGSLDVSLGGLSCIADGQYIVHDVGYDDRGYLLRLALDFVVNCGAKPFVGYVRYRSVVPVRSRAPIASAGDNQQLIPGQPARLSAKNSWPGLEPISLYRWRQVSGPAIPFGPSNASQIDLEAPQQVPPNGETYTFELRVRNASGVEDTDRVSVHVQGDAERKSFAFIEVQSPGGDYVFGSGSRYLDANTGAFRSFGQDVGTAGELLRLEFNDHTDWNFWFYVGADGLEQGVYPSMDSSIEDRTYLAVSGDGRGVNHSLGSMVIHEIERDDDGRIKVLAFDFLMLGGAPVRGVVRYNSRVPLVSPTPLASAGPDQESLAGDVVRLDASNSYFGSAEIASVLWTQVGGPPVALEFRGRNAWFTAPEAGGELEFELTITTADGQQYTSRVRVSVEPAGERRSVLILDGDPGERLTFGQRFHMPMEAWRAAMRLEGGNQLDVNLAGLPHAAVVRLRAPFDRLLKVGSYENARSYEAAPLGPAHLPGLAVTVESGSCTPSRGRFEVRELRKDSVGQVLRLAVDFQQACGSSDRWLRGQLRVNSAVPVGSSEPLAAAGTDLKVHSGQKFRLDAGASGSWLDLPVTTRWQQVSGPHVDVPQPSARAMTLTAPVVEVGAAMAEFELQADDPLGQTSVDRVAVTIVGASERWNELNVTRTSVATGKSVRKARHDANNAYQTLGHPTPTSYTLRSDGPELIFMSFGVDEDNAPIPEGLVRLNEGLPRFDFTGFGGNVNCSGVEGALRVVDARYSGGSLNSLAIDFDVHCGLQQFWGYARINSAVPVETGRVFADAGTDLELPETGQALLNGLGSLIVGSRIETYSWRQISGPAVSLRVEDRGRASFIAPQVSADSDVILELEVTGTGNAKGTDQIRVHVMNTGTSPPPGGGGGGSGGGGPLHPTALAALLLLTLERSLSRRRRFGIMPAACRTDFFVIRR